MIDNFFSEPMSGQLIELFSIESTAEEMLKKIINDFLPVMEVKKNVNHILLLKNVISIVHISLDVSIDIQRINEILTTMFDPDDLKVNSCPALHCRSFTLLLLK